ncbi:MAG: carboxypeptidase-like regulatory domain-containing protein [Gemmatales bacterium]|nr:carboxypeptidase-like regulatory domain-containing protein [Gemmatales bacterium]MDW8174098.1 carboxypeptidase-like regulatory domain-containing protein [Gemmatales bacterium]
MMERSRIASLMLITGLTTLGLLLLGCRGEQKPEKKVEEEQKPPAKAKVVTLEPAGYAKAITGRVTYTGPEADAKVIFVATKLEDKGDCPKEVPGQGWYVDESQDKKGVRYAVVYVRAATGYRMPPLDKLERTEKDPEFVELRQPSCQFEPRVLLLPPTSKLRVWNDSDKGHKPIDHDANISGLQPMRLSPGKNGELDVPPDDREPRSVTCGIHSGFMRAYIWKFSHPYAAITDKDGQYRIPHVLVPKEGKLELWVWHEMLGKSKKVQDLTLKAGEEVKVDITLP